jgi:hypothetical protein
MAREIKSLLFNLEDGKDVPRHRIHRSKRGRNRRDKETNEAFWKFKRKKIDLSTDWEVKSLLYKNSRYRIK